MELQFNLPQELIEKAKINYLNRRYGDKNMYAETGLALEIGSHILNELNIKSR